FGFVFDLQDRFALPLYTEQFLAFVLGCCIGLAYLGGRDGRVPWWEVVAALAGFLACMDVAIGYPRLSQVLAERPPEGIVLGTIIILLVLEGVRRTAGMSLVAVVGAF